MKNVLNFFLYTYIKIVNKYYKRKQRKASKRNTEKIPKSFWKRKEKKKALDRYKNLSEEEKE